ncbi:hypothetical protein U9M48_011572 [Paspalum notatum var. saurae]|uniref:Uncharacterized protein n=1 Tax=Paspalum notatum var. saurae TaxID=547442 RepID=A0AAQ3SVZ7_PASNO
MTPRFYLALLVVLCSSHLISSIRRASDNDSPLAAYLVAVRRPDGLVGVDEPQALEQWHTHLLEQVCNTSDPATAVRFPTAESRLIYSYSHVVSGFSAWLTPREVEDMARLPWFVEAIPDKSYKLMAVDTPAAPESPWLDNIRDGVWSAGNMGEGMIIGILDAGVAAGHILTGSEAEGMLSPPAKWKGSCDNDAACNNKLIGFKTFAGTSEALGNSVQRASVLGIDYGEAFAVAPKAHLAIYHVCNEVCHPKAVKAGMDAAVHDGVDVISVTVSSTGDDAGFRDDSVAAPSYNAVAQGVLVCTPAGSSSPEMLKVESNAPWLLTVAASDTDRRVVTNVELGNGILKPDVSAPGANADTIASAPHGGAEFTDAEIKAATSIAVGSLADSVDFLEPLSRSKFEELNDDLFRKVVALVDRVLAEAELQRSKNKIDEIVLVGGSSMILKIQRLVKDYFGGREPNVSVKPDEAVALGAALHFHSSH